MPQGAGVAVLTLALAAVAVHGITIEPDRWSAMVGTNGGGNAGINVPSTGYRLKCKFSCRNMPDLHDLFNPFGKIKCPQDVPKPGSCPLSNPHCLHTQIK